jgi:AbrB family looped-hinge helix DNA binding protein
MDMKNRAVVSERGTITIPEPIREIVDIHPGDLIEFTPQKDRIILRHLVVEYPEEKSLMTNSEWKKFDRLIQDQLKKERYRSYDDTDKAKLHSRRLMRKR